MYIKNKGDAVRLEIVNNWKLLPFVKEMVDFISFVNKKRVGIPKAMFTIPSIEKKMQDLFDRGFL